MLGHVRACDCVCVSEQAGGALVTIQVFSATPGLLYVSFAKILGAAHASMQWYMSKYCPVQLALQPRTWRQSLHSELTGLGGTGYAPFVVNFAAVQTVHTRLVLLELQF